VAYVRKNKLFSDKKEEDLFRKKPPAPERWGLGGILMIVM
jgi:hypothetical protein